MRFFHLGHQSLWIDEVFTWQSAGVGSPLALAALLENVHGPLYSLLVRLSCAIAGESEWALRVSSAVAGVALVPAIAWLAALWLGRGTVSPAAWLAAGSPYLVWYSQEARGYSLVMLCTALSGAALLALTRRPAVAQALAYTGATAAGLLSNFSFALIAPLHLRWWLAGGEDRGRRLRLLALTAAGLALLALPWAPSVLGIWDWQRLHPASEAGALAPPLRGATTFHAAAIPFAAHAFAVGYTLGPPLRDLRAEASTRTLARHLPELLATALLFGVLGAMGIAEIARRRRLADLAVWLFAPALIVSYFAIQNFKVFHPRYLSAAFPGFLLVLAAAFAARGRRARWALGLALGVLWLLSLQHHYFDPRYAKEDHRGVAALVRERGVEGETMLAVNSEDPMAYYYRGPLPQERLWLGFAGRPGLEARLDRALGEARGAWVVLSRPEDLDPKGAFARMLDSRYPDAERFSFTGVRVWHLRRSGP